MDHLRLLLNRLQFNPVHDGIGTLLTAATARRRGPGELIHQKKDK